MARCFFGDFTDKALEPADRQYAEVPGVPAALAAVEEALADYNATSKRPMALAMFLHALEHVSRISRLMKQPGGHMLLIGVGGSGRQSLARLVSFMSGLELFQVCVCV
jgi:dynein heavy chain